MNSTAKAMAALANLATVDRGLSVLETSGVISIDERISLMRRYVEKYPEIKEVMERVLK